MEVRELRSFCAAVRLRSITRAAELLGLGQATVTGHVKKLEREFGQLLFDRARRPIEPTALGMRLYELATPLLDGIDGLIRRASERESTGPVRVVATYAIVRHMLPDVLKMFVSSHPHVRLQVSSGTAEQVLQSLEEAQADVGLVSGRPKSVHLDSEYLCSYGRVLLVPSGHRLLESPPRSIDEVAKWPLVLGAPGTSSRVLLEEEFRRRGLEYEVVLEVDTSDTVKRYVALGLGISVVLEIGIEPEDYGYLGIVDLSSLLPQEEVHIVTRRGKTIPTPVGNFISMVKDRIVPFHSGLRGGRRAGRIPARTGSGAVE